VLLGIEHILTGADHLLFVSGLLLLVSGVRRLLLTVSAFTLSHTITLTLATSMLGVTSLRALLSSTYSFVDLSQPGFNSIYLPGYNFLPLLVLVGLRVGGLPPTGFPSGPRA
jgi:hypothetical protein